MPCGLRAELKHRWSFNNTSGAVTHGTALTDSVSGTTALVVGTGATFSGSQLTLPGNTGGIQTAANIAGYLDLPNGILSSKTSVTVEAWATPLSAKGWMRLFDFGRSADAGVGGGAPGEITANTAVAPAGGAPSDNLMLSFCRGLELGQQRFEIMRNGVFMGARNTDWPTTVGQQYLYTMVFEGGAGAYGAAGGQLTWYRDGVVIATMPVAFRLADLQDVNNWIGRSNWTWDSNAHMSLNELRIYDHALTQEDITANHLAGPDAPPGQAPNWTVAPTPVNRWTFNTAAGTAPSGTVFDDVISGTPAIVRGHGATLNGAKITLPGGTNGNQTAANISAYLDLPNGILSSKPNFTIEAWCAPLSSQTDQRLFDFGRSTATRGPGALLGEIIDDGTIGGFAGFDNLALTLNSGAAFGQNRLEGQYNGAPPILFETNLTAVTEPGREYHYVLVVEDNKGLYGTGGSVSKWYRNGVLQDVLPYPFHMNQLADVNNWVGRSQYSGDMNAHFALNEMRIYDRALTPAEILASYHAGAEAQYGPVVAVADSVTIHAGQKVRVDVVQNDTGGIAHPLYLEVTTAPAVGTATVQNDGTILYAHAGVSTAPVMFAYRVLGQGGWSAPATVTVNVSSALRIANVGLNVPDAPPTNRVAVESAFGELQFNKPLAFASPPGDTQRLFVCEIEGNLKVIPDVSAATPTSAVVLDLPALLATRIGEVLDPGPFGENGLLGMAFHPQFATNGYFFVTYTVQKASDPGVWYDRLARFTIPAGQINSPTPAADPASELIFIERRIRGPNHHGGDIHFGADGYLYTAYGDEENANDFRNNSQRIDLNFFGAMLRIDVDRLPANLEPNPHASIPTDAGVARYKVPADNPYVGVTTFNGITLNPANVRTEFWSVGLRSPWRFSIDAPTGELWCGDVGQDIYEEIHLLSSGTNAGWAFRDGLHPGPKAAQAPAGFTSSPPIYEYLHTGVAGGDGNYKGNSIIGGVVYRGTRIPSLTGAYIFGDQVSGHIWALTRPGGVVTVQRIAGSPSPVNFGHDPSNGDILFSAYFNGKIMRLKTALPDDSYPTTLSATGVFADLTDLSPAPGLLPYTPNLTFWSDFAVKNRWFTLPEAGSKMTWSKDGVWTFPNGGVWVKHFDMEMTRGNPATKKRLETRLLVKNTSGVYGVSYRWNDAQTEATLVADAGEDFDLNVIENGTPRVQHWSIPSRSQCMACHTSNAGGMLSFNTRQLNRSGTLNGVTGNQLDLLEAAGYFHNPVPSTNLLPRHVRPDETAFPIEARVRSYLDVNCSYCHQAGGSGPAWDGRAHLTLTQTGMINGFGVALHAGDKLIVPGDTLHSIILSRTAAINGYTRMPPLATSELDQTGIQLLTDWINHSLPSRQTYANWRLAQFGSSTSPEGAPYVDADADGATNMAEFLAFTNPLSGVSSLKPTLNVAGTTATLTFDVPANRSFIIETTDDLVNWVQWDTPGNSGQAQPGGSVTISGPSNGERQFFRLRLSEN
ncbi:LamG-like jellyroll fold domain-containing protein [Phragmitibacter flavus]|nr:LamG-like jellyroll fold domain-containing protein [Phragmitibacter flavus]